MDSYIIELNGLTKKYGDFTAVDHLDLFIKKGEVFGLLGPNGAGKSTSILMMLGLSDPTLGSVKVCGIDATRNPIEVKRKIGYLPDDVGFYDNYTGLENLLYTARLNQVAEKEAVVRAEQMLKRVGLSSEAHKKAGKYSRGMRQRLGLADLMIKNPEVIILDEPTLGIDPKGVREFLDLIVQLSREEGVTVLLCSHHLHQVQQVCDRVGIFVGGKLLATGDIQTLSKQLFQEELATVTLGVKLVDGVETRESLMALLKAVNGVREVRAEHNLFHLSCMENISGQIARTIVENNFELMHLQHKEYGLDEIYHRYFEGGQVHGKAN